MKDKLRLLMSQHVEIVKNLNRFNDSSLPEAEVNKLFQSIIDKSYLDILPGEYTRYARALYDLGRVQGKHQALK